MHRCNPCGFEAESAFRFCPDCGAQQVATVADPRIGRILSERYRIVDKLGQGSMGSVYLAEHTALETRVAIKVLHRDLAVDESTLQRFRREGVAAGQIDHPNAIRIFDLGREDDGTVYLAMEYVGGRSLEQLLADDGPLPPEEAIDLATQLLETLGAAHRRGVVHRDLKPANLMVVDGEDGGRTLKVLDFGLSKLVDRGQDASLMTRSGHVLGTPMYMAPEQWTGAAVDARTDLYAVALILFEMLSGERAHSGSDVSEIFVDCTQGPPPSLADRSRAPAFPVEVDAVLSRALAKDPDARFANADEMLEELLAARLDRTARPGAGRSRGTATVRSRRRGGASTTGREPSSALRAGAVGALVAIAGAVGWFTFGAAGSAVAEPAGLIRERAPDSWDERERAYARWLDEAESELRVGAIDRARTAVEKALALPVADADGLLVRARVFRAAGDDDAARSDLSQALYDVPDLTAAAAELGWIELEAGATEAAEQRFRAVAAADGECADAVAGMAAIDLQRGRVDAALATLRPAAERFPAAGRVQAWLGRAALADGDVDAAIPALIAAKRHDPQRIAARVDLARAYLMRGSRTEAERELVASIEIAPDAVAPRLELAALRLGRDDAAGAFAVLDPVRAALDRGPDLLLLGLAAHAAGAVDLDIDATLRRAMDAGLEAPERVDRLLAIRALDAGRFADAIRAGEAALHSDAGDVESGVVVAVARFRSGDFAGAAADFEGVIAVRPDHVYAQRSLGLLYRDYLDRPADALRCFEAAHAAGDADPRLDGWIRELRG